MRGKKLGLLTLCGTILFFNSAVVLGVETDGFVSFTPSKDLVGETIKPEQHPEEVILPESGSATTGLLRLQHIPDFDFGEQELEVGGKEYSPVVEKYLSKDPTKPNTYGIPHFIQVTDIRGTGEGWTLKVSASVFENENGHQLSGTRILLKEGKLSNDVFVNNIADKVDVFGNLQEIEIPTTTQDGKIILQTKKGNQETTTDGTRTSLVLNKAYAPTNFYKLDEKNTGVKLVKPATDVPLVNTNYTSVILWDLVNGL